MAPGTMGTLAAIPMVFLLSLFHDSFYAAFTLGCLIIGTYICNVATRNLDIHDHSGIVWDEIVGLMITMVFIPFSWPALIAGFLLFRLFDILKPWPIRYIDRRVHGGLGIMIDDVVAAIFANILLRFILPYLPGL